MSKRLALALSLILAVASIGLGKTVVVRVNARDYQELYNHVTFKGTSIDIAGARTGQSYDLVMDERDVPTVQGCGLKTEVIVPDLDYWQQLSGSFGSYRSYADHVTLTRNWANLHPEICLLESIGPSYEGRWIYGLKITQNPSAQDSTKPEVIIYAQIHAREWAASEMMDHLIDTLLRNYATNSSFQDWINHHQLWIFPLFNVDGYSYDYPGQLMWRKNRQPFGGATGTDMNRDAGGVCNGDAAAQFGSLVSGSRTSNYPDDDVFCGATAFFAPEMQALVKLFKAHTFVMELSVHTYSELVLWSYGHGPETPDNTYISRICTGTAQQIGALGGGTYTPEHSTSLYPTNGDVEDFLYGWSRELGGHPCFDIEFECGTDFYQSTSDLDGMATQVFKGTWYWLNHTDTTLVQMKPLVPPPALNLIDTSSDGNYTVHWTPLEPAWNLPDMWQLEELQGITVGTESVEGATGAWTLQGATVSTSQHHSGTHSFFLGNSSNMDNWIVTDDPYPVSSVNDSVTFWTYYNLENNYDIGVVEVSLEGKDWFQLDNRYTGTQTSWVRKAYSLAPWLGKSVYIRIRSASDDGTNSGGMYVDDIYPRPVFSTHTTISNTITDTLYAFTGKPVGDYWYRVGGHNAAWAWGDKGTLSHIYVGATGVVEKPVQPAPAPRVTGITSLAPNPFANRLAVAYSIARQGPVSLNVYNTTGRLIRTLVSTAQNPGQYSASWDGKDGSGHQVANGVYVLRLAADRIAGSRTLLLR